MTVTLSGILDKKEGSLKRVILITEAINNLSSPGEEKLMITLLFSEEKTADFPPVVRLVSNRIDTSRIENVNNNHKHTLRWFSIDLSNWKFMHFCCEKVRQFLKPPFPTLPPKHLFKISFPSTIERNSICTSGKTVDSALYELSSEAHYRPFFRLMHNVLISIHYSWPRLSNKIP